MKTETLLMGLVIVVSVLSVGIAVAACNEDILGKCEGNNEQSEADGFVALGETQSGIYGVMVTTVRPSTDELLGKYETCDKQFRRIEIGDMIVYGHQRKVDYAIVEGDYINYQFDKHTKELIKKRIHWRNDLPEHEHMPPAPTLMITKEHAESMVGGEVQFTSLYIISPDSVVFPLKPTPKNPCWIVRSIDNGGMIVTIIDAINGKILGYGVPPPYTGFSLSGPEDIANCTVVWTAWYQNASSWFNTMGYPTEAVIYPDEAKVQSHVQSNETVMFYELAHGGSYSFANNCSDSTNATEIHNWIENYTKMPFTFLGSCGGMCDVSSNTLSYEFRKCSRKNTVTVGYCGMATPNCSNAWINSVDWQDAMFNYMNQSDTVKEAFDKATADYPMCVGCMRFAGDENFAVVPVVERGDLTEVEKAIEKGLCWLNETQNLDGSWGNNVGYTSLAALAFLNYGIGESDPAVSKAINYILSNKHPDGSIYISYSNYETSLAILPLVATHNSSYDDEITAARNFLVGIQNDESEGLSNTDWTYGGWGYGANSPTWSDLSNTQWSLMGLDAANLSETSDTWSKGELYVTRCQNWQATNPYAVTNDGGFTYQPPSISCCWGCGGDPSQSYGAMSAAGVWSLRLCGVDTSDQRVQEGLNWLRDNYAPIDTVGNPCYGDTYLYYYLLSFAKTLIMTEIPSGSWQETASQDITDYIVSQQHDDGHWSSNEGDLFATEQAILALQTRTIPTNIQRLSWLTFILHSNADMHVYDPLGRHVGMNYDTGEIEIEIPSATYSANPQNITMPVLVPGNYRIVLVGTGTGEYTLDVTGGVGDDIVAEDSFTATISEGEVHDANVNVAMITWLTIHIEEPDPIDAMVESATGTGNVSFVTDAGTIEDLAALSESDLPEENPGADFPHGLFSFNITGLSNGATVNVTINFPEDTPTTAQYWKYNTASGEWYQIPIGSNDGDHIVTITLQDGGIGDNDGATNGIISDPGGPGVNIYNITFLPPITTMDHFNLTYGRTLPIKFTARDNDTGEFIYDDTVNVTITNSTGHLIVFFTSGTGTDSVRINPIKEQYIVNFHTKNYDLNVGETYTIHVTFGEADALRGYAMTHFTLVDRKH